MTAVRLVVAIVDAIESIIRRIN